MEKLISHSRIIHIYELLDMIKHGNLEFRKELIKQANQNTEKLRIKAIENIILGLPTPQIIINRDYWAPTIISGNFLIQSIVDFTENKFKLHSNNKYNLNLKDIYFRDFNFTQNRNFLESQIILVEYLGEINPLIKCALYRETNKYTENVAYLNQKVREICFPQGSLILSDFTKILKYNNIKFYNDIKMHTYRYSENSLTLSLLLLCFYNNRNKLNFKTSYSYDDNFDIVFLKDKLMAHLDLNINDSTGGVMFMHSEDIDKYIKNENIDYFLKNLYYSNINIKQPLITKLLINNEDMNFHQWLSRLNF